MTHALGLTCTDLAPLRAGRAVAEGVGFALRPGDALVLRGANGSGKTSILRAVAGLCRYEGDVTFTCDGERADPAAVRAEQIHLLADGAGLSAKLTAAEHVAFWAGLYGEAPGRGLRAAGLEAAAGQPASRLSTGQRRRLGLTRLSLTPRGVWLLDEPLSGLDAAARTRLGDAVDAHRAAGGIVLLATHEAERLPGAPTLRLGR